MVFSIMLYKFSEVEEAEILPSAHAWDVWELMKGHQIYWSIQRVAIENTAIL